MSVQTVEILLVEDNPHDAELALYALRKYNVARYVDVVKDGAEALDYMFHTGMYADSKDAAIPKVVFLDLKLPKVDGLEVLRRVKADPRTRLIPVVILSSSQEEQDVLISYKLGVNSYIVKPIDFDQFTEAVRQVGIYWLRHNHVPPLASYVDFLNHL